VAENINWSALVFEPAFMSNITKVAVKRFGDDVLSEECASFVLEGLASDNWKRCQAFKGQSKPTTFLYTIASNLVEEFARKKFGRPRPPTWLKNQGDLWVALWKAICLERQFVASVVDRFCQNGLRTAATIEHSITVIKARIPSCGQPGFCERSYDEIEELSDRSGMATSANNNYMEGETEVLNTVRVTLESIMSEHPAQLAEVEENGEQSSFDISALRKLLSLTDQERVLLRMIYFDGVSKQKAAVAIGLPPHKGGRVVNAVLSRIQKAVSDCGLDFDSLSSALG
jgi:RNA polymerase sigma factor (sigma-70 family)